jgi:integrase
MEAAMPLLTSSTPKYQQHRASGQAVVTLDARDFYLGPYGSKASRVEYDRLIGQWLANGRRLPQNATPDSTVAELLDAYLRFAEVYYAIPACGCTAESGTIKQAMRYPARLYSTTPAAEFGPLALKTCRAAMIKDDLCRTHINQQVGRIKRMFKWAVEQELVDANVWHALQAVSGLRAGKTEARESKPVKPVAEEDVNATLPHFSPIVRAMVELQLITGMRPGEICAMRSCDIDTTGALWVYRPLHHKTEHHGHERVIYLGPRAQAVLRPLLKPDLQAYIFSPAEAEAWFRAQKHAKRRTPLTCGNVPGSNCKCRPVRRPSDRFKVTTYRRAIARACDRAFPPPAPVARQVGETAAEWKARLTPEQILELRRWRDQHRWHPHQLRHTAATKLRREYGLEAAQVILGHKTLTVTQVYAEKNVEAARKIMAQVG